MSESGNGENFDLRRPALQVAESMPAAVTEGLGKSVLDRFTAGGAAPAEETTDVTHPGPAPANPWVTGRSRELSWRHDPEPTEAPRPSRKRVPRPPQLRRGPTLRVRRDRPAPSVAASPRESSRRHRPLAAAAVVLVLAAIAGMAILSAGGTATPRPAARAIAAHTTGSGFASLLPIVTLAKDAVATIARQDARAARERQAAHRTVERRATRRVRRTHHTATGAHARVVSTSASSGQAKPQSPPASPSEQSNSPSQPYSAPSTPAPTHHIQAGPTGPGTTVGKNCDPQCS